MEKCVNNQVEDALRQRECVVDGITEEQEEDREERTKPAHETGGSGSTGAASDPLTPPAKDKPAAKEPRP